MPEIAGVNVSPLPVPSVGETCPADVVDIRGLVDAPPKVSGMLLSTYHGLPRIDPTGPSAAAFGSNSAAAFHGPCADGTTSGRLFVSAEVAIAYHAAGFVTIADAVLNRFREICDSREPMPW